MINIKGIAFQGAKGLGKDTLAGEIIKFHDINSGIILNRYAFGDILKELTIDKNQEYYEMFKDKYNFDYLESDIFDFRNNEGNIKNNLFLKINSDEILKINEIISKDFGDITMKEKLYMIEFFKNIPELRTRIHIQTYSDIIKKETGNISYFSEYLIKKIKENNNNVIKNVINTDTRFLIEAIDLLLNDFILVKITNSFLNNSFKGKEHLQHMSETELGINNNNIGIVIDTTDLSNINDPLRRMSLEQSFDSYKKKVLPVLNAFKGYSDNFKNEIKKIKNKIKKDKKYFDLQHNYSMQYKKYYSADDKNKLKIEKDLRSAYNAYDIYIKRYINKINDAINNELFKYNKLNNLNKIPKIKNI